MALIQFTYTQHNSKLVYELSIVPEDLPKLFASKLGAYSEEKDRYEIKDGCRPATKSLANRARKIAHEIWVDLASNLDDDRYSNGSYCDISREDALNVYRAMSADLAEFDVTINSSAYIDQIPTQAPPVCGIEITTTPFESPTPITLLDQLIDTQTNILELVRSLRRTL